MKMIFRQEIMKYAGVSVTMHSQPKGVNILKPNTYFMYQHFNVQKFCVLPTMHLRVLCGSQNKQRLFLYTALTCWFL
jgi:hypothetical protein